MTVTSAVLPLSSVTFRCVLPPLHDQPIAFHGFARGLATAGRDLRVERSLSRRPGTTWQVRIFLSLSLLSGSIRFCTAAMDDLGAVQTERWRECALKSQRKFSRRLWVPGPPRARKTVECEFAHADDCRRLVYSS